MEWKGIDFQKALDQIQQYNKDNNKDKSADIP